MSRLILFLSSFVLVAIIGFFIIQYAKGLRFDTQKLGFRSTGILAATSNPNGAQVFVNGKLVTATNQSLNLSPDTYDIQIAKEGYFPWQKRLTINEAVVTKIDAILLPKAPTLSPLTIDGARQPFISPDGTKLVWNVESKETDKNGLWLIELANLPFGFAREARRITDITVEDAAIIWSPNGRNLLVQQPNSTFLLDTGNFTPQGSLIALSKAQIDKTLASWSQERTKRQQAKINQLPDQLQDILERKSTTLVFSPDETKILYTASAAAKLSDNLIPPVPGSSTQKQERAIKENTTYIYDIKEDRNFLVKAGVKVAADLVPITKTDTTVVRWFPTSRHVVMTEKDGISIVEYDGTNGVRIWSGPYQIPFAFPTPDGGQLIVLTNFGATNGESPNLYTISLR